MPTTLIEEMRSAARGMVSLLLGRREASDHFDFSQRGLAGSFVVLLVASLANALLPLLLISEPGYSVGRSLLLVGFLYLVQIGFAALVLRQLGRLDGLIPYLVADNWATFFVTILSMALLLVGVSGDFAIIALGLVVLILEINLARLIVTLTPMQIAMFLIAQMVGVLLGLGVLGVVMPVDPALLPPPETITPVP